MTSAIVKLWSLKYDHLVIIACSKMREVKSHRYVKIMNNNNGFVFQHEMFHIYSVLSYKIICCMKFDDLQQQ